MSFINRAYLRFDRKVIQPIISFGWRLKNKNKTFSIISNNCWGGGIYQELKVPYYTPTIGLFFYPNDYIKFLTNLKHYCTDAELSFTKSSKHKLHTGQYPIGLLDGEIEIHFLHYKNEDEAREKWNRRKKRINWDNLYIKMDDRDGCTEEHCTMFDKLPYKNKIFFSASIRPYKSSVYLPKCGGGNVDELYGNKHLWRNDFDIVSWLNK